jgi:lipopolysaccharide transport system permease protein
MNSAPHSSIASAEVTEPVTRIVSDFSAFELGLRDLWEARALLLWFAWRDVIVRYKQTFLGLGWALLQPLATMAVFYVALGIFVRVPSDGLPYPLFALSGLLPWFLFAGVLTACSHSLISNAALITKIYFPRLVLSLSIVAAPLVDFAIGFALLLIAVAVTAEPSFRLLFVPFFIFLALGAALGPGLIFAALSARYRDVRFVVPFVVQLGMFSSPVIYPLSMVPERWRMLVALNPMVAVIEGFRWSVTGVGGPTLPMLLVAVLVTLASLLSGLVVFRWAERSLADVI